MHAGLLFGIMAALRKPYTEEWPAKVQFVGADFVGIPLCSIPPDHWLLPVYTNGHCGGILRRVKTKDTLAAHGITVCSGQLYRVSRVSACIACIGRASFAKRCRCFDIDFNIVRLCVYRSYTSLQQFIHSHRQMSCRLFLQCMYWVCDIDLAAHMYPRALATHAARPVRFQSVSHSDNLQRSDVQMHKVCEHANTRKHFRDMGAQCL